MNALATRVLGINSACWMVASYPTYEGQLYGYDHCIRTEFGLEEAFSWQDSFVEPEDQIMWKTYASECRWRPGKFDAAIHLVADDKEAAALWVSKETKAIFAPYDGGTDLILPNSENVNILKKEFSDWLSTHPHGL
jgi:hypothetical protein